MIGPLTFFLLLVSISAHDYLHEAIGRVEPVGNYFPQNAALKKIAPYYRVASHLQDRAIPTNYWWGNLIIGNGDHIDPVWSNPFRLQYKLDSEPRGLRVNYPNDHRFYGGNSGNGDNTVAYYSHGSATDIALSAMEFDTTVPKMEIQGWDDLSVRVQLQASGTKSITTDLVLGMAFITAKYSGLRPSITSPNALVTVNGAPIAREQTYSVPPGRKLALKFNSGQHWGLYNAGTRALELKVNNKRTGLVSLTEFNGDLRLAYLKADALDIYDRAADCVVESGKLVLESEEKYRFDWKTKGLCSQGLLHYGLIHHTDVIIHDNDLRKLDRIYDRQASTRGVMPAFLATIPAQWRFQETFPIDVGFYPSTKIAKKIVKKYDIAKLLVKEIREKWDDTSKGSYYFKGKKMQMYASLCLMAKDENVLTDGGQLFAECVEKLKHSMNCLIDNSRANPLVYDPVFGGIVSSEGFSRAATMRDFQHQWKRIKARSRSLGGSSPRNAGADFGNALYNDHHYHWGYWITAAAMLRHLDPSWDRHGELQRRVEFLIRDVVNPNAEEDKAFPAFRNFNWYLGHSYSHGITPFADGKDEESTSEEFNFMYGLVLWGQMTKNKQLQHMGKLMMKLNRRAIQKYFLKFDDNEIHPENFKPNKVTGIFFDNKVHYATWFSPHRHCIHGIQMLPISPITDIYRPHSFVQEEWDAVLRHLPIIKDPSVRDAWQSLLYANFASINPIAAMEKLAYVPMDDGLSRAWALYLAGCRHGIRP